jgi:hypothetical protein
VVCYVCPYLSIGTASSVLAHPYPTLHINSTHTHTHYRIYSTLRIISQLQFISSPRPSDILCQGSQHHTHTDRVGREGEGEHVVLHSRRRHAVVHVDPEKPDTHRYRDVRGVTLCEMHG